MKFFSWVQNKINTGGSQATRKPSVVVPPLATSTSTQATVEEVPKEPFNDWSNGLLTIGTLGIRDQREDQEIQRAGQIAGTDNNSGEVELTSSPDLTEFTPEEVGQLQKELKRLLKRKPKSQNHAPLSKDQKEEPVIQDLPLDRFLNCPSSRSISSRYSVFSDQSRDLQVHGGGDEEDIVDRTIKAIIGRCKQVCMESKNNKSMKKSVSFLFKKMFACGGGFSQAPNLRETLLQETRMEKLLRTMLSKKMHPQNSSRASSTRRYLVDINPNSLKAQQKDEEEAQNKQADGPSKWVKTDSEYIVLDLD